MQVNIERKKVSSYEIPDETILKLEEEAKKLKVTPSNLLDYCIHVYFRLKKRGKKYG